MGHGLFSVSQSTKHVSRRATLWSMQLTTTCQSSRMWTGWRAAAIRSTGTLTSNTIRRHVSTGGPVRDYAVGRMSVSLVLLLIIQGCGASDQFGAVQLYHSGKGAHTAPAGQVVSNYRDDQAV